MQSAEESAQCLRSFILYVVEVEVQAEGLEVAGLDLVDAVANGLGPHLSNVVEVEIQTKSVQVLLGLDSLSDYLSALSSDLIGIQVQIESLQIGSLQVSLKESQRFRSQSIADQHQRVALQSFSQSSEPEVVISHSIILN